MPLTPNDTPLRNDEEIAALRKEIHRLRSVIDQLTPDLESLLQFRGFKVFKKEPDKDLILPCSSYVDTYYRLLHNYSFRILLRDIIKHQHRFSLYDISRYATPDVCSTYLAFLEESGIISRLDGTHYQLTPNNVPSFGVTLEWFVAEIFKREFACQSMWGVKFKRKGVGGDYDLLTKIEGQILYMEVKSSPPKQIHDREIAAFLNRIDDLNPGLALFFMDTELRMKDKIVPMFEHQLQRRFAKPPKITRIIKELFQVDNQRIFIINAKGRLVGNIEKALSCHFSKSQPSC